MSENIVTPEQRELMDEYLSLVVEANKSVNLTRIDGLEQGRLLHTEDSLTAIPEVSAAPEGAAADLGTGGGFPGVPLAIATQRPFTLVDSVGKKVRAIAAIIERMGLQGYVSTYTGRIEELAQQSPGEYSLLVSRALTSLPSLLELASPLLGTNGVLVCYKSGDYREELDLARSIQCKLGMEHVGARELVLSDGSTKRCIITFIKSGEPKVALPRRPGMAQKRPYRP